MEPPYHAFLYEKKLEERKTALEWGGMKKVVIIESRIIRNINNKMQKLNL